MAGYGVAGGVAEGFGGVMTWVEEARLASKADVDGKADLDPVTGKVVASQLPSGGGGGGAGIDDGITGADTTWSSQKIDAELTAKADDKFLVMDAESGDLQETEDTLAVGVAKGLMYLPYYLAAFSEFADSTGITISAALPEFTEPGQLYAVRDPATGVITWHMPTIPA